MIPIINQKERMIGFVSNKPERYSWITSVLYVSSRTALANELPFQIQKYKNRRKKRTMKAKLVTTMVTCVLSIDPVRFSFFCTTMAKWTLLFFACLFSFLVCFALLIPKIVRKSFEKSRIAEIHREGLHLHTPTVQQFKSGHSYQQKIVKSRRPRNSSLRI